MFTLAVYAIISAGLLLWLLARKARDRWVAAGDKAEALADLSKPATVDEHAARALAIVREKPLIPPRGTHRHPCGCWCGPDDRKRLCPTHALQAQDIRDMLRLETWERERHEP
jgi:hypothetical protein